MLRRMSRPPLIVALIALAALAAPARAADRPIVGTDRLAQPAEPAPLDNANKHFLKTEPSRAPRLSAKPDGVSPILPPLALKGHRDSPPTTTAPIKPGKANNPPPSTLGPE
jgi:hypothetical protein